MCGNLHMTILISYKKFLMRQFKLLHKRDLHAFRWILMVHSLKTMSQPYT